MWRRVVVQRRKAPGVYRTEPDAGKSDAYPAAYSIYSAALHADWHSVAGNWKQVIMTDGTRAMVISPHRVAVWGAVPSRRCSGQSSRQARALGLLDHRARLIEVDRWRSSTLSLIRRMDLPRSWWW